MYRDSVTTQVKMQFSNLFSEFLNLQIKSNYLELSNCHSYKGLVKQNIC